ncbi:MAG: histidine kinase [Planctomycetaceae bacterium]|nr:histidine kinase [Planctomycetaceae bacterium]
MSTDPGNHQSVFRATWSTALAAWCAISVSLTVTFALSDGIVLGTVRPVYLSVLGMVCATLWLACAPIIAAVSRSALLTSCHRIAAFGIHLLAALLFALACTGGFAVLMWLADRGLRQTPLPFATTFQSSTFYFLLANTVFYGFVVASQRFVDQRSEVQVLRTREAKMQSQLVTARMEVMRIQMQPHFLFNSLNSVSSLVRLEESNKAIQALQKLGAVLRTTLAQHDQPFATLESELDVLHEYMELEQIRFGERLRYELAIAPDTRPLWIPRWTLQPLVENAIIHGIERKLDAGQIAIRAERCGEQLSIEIFDDGVGLSERRPNGLGLGNTQQRLQDLYGDKASLELRSNGGGTTASLRLPIRETVHDE